MEVNPGIFKAYDIRGIYPTKLNEEVGYALGRAFASFLQVDKVIVGRDMRRSGPQMFEAVSRGLMDQGANVFNIGMVSTDQYYYACATLGLAGMMVTAEVLSTRKRIWSLLASSGFGLTSCSSCMALRPSGVAALSSPSMLAAMFMTMLP